MRQNRENPSSLLLSLGPRARKRGSKREERRAETEMQIGAFARRAEYLPTTIVISFGHLPKTWLDLSTFHTAAINRNTALKLQNEYRLAVLTGSVSLFQCVPCEETGTHM